MMLGIYLGLKEKYKKERLDKLKKDKEKLLRLKKETRKVYFK